MSDKRPASISAARKQEKSCSQRSCRDGSLEMTLAQCWDDIAVFSFASLLFVSRDPPPPPPKPTFWTRKELVGCFPKCSFSIMIERMVMHRFIVCIQICPLITRTCTRRCARHANPCSELVRGRTVSKGRSGKCCRKAQEGDVRTRR